MQRIYHQVLLITTKRTQLKLLEEQLQASSWLTRLLLWNVTLWHTAVNAAGPKSQHVRLHSIRLCSQKCTSGFTSKMLQVWEKHETHLRTKHQLSVCDSPSSDRLLSFAWSSMWRSSLQRCHRSALQGTLGALCTRIWLQRPGMAEFQRHRHWYLSHPAPKV